MSENVNVVFGADASKMAKEFDKMNDKLRSSANEIDKLKNKSKRAGKEGLDSFSGMAKAGTALALSYMSVSSAINGVISKMHELRGMRDEASKATSESLTKVFKEAEIEDPNKKGQLQNSIRAIADNYKIKFAESAALHNQALNEDVSIESIHKGSLFPVAKLMSATGASPDTAFNLNQSALRREGLNFNTAKKEDIIRINQMLATSGKDVQGLDSFLAKMPKELSIEDAIVLSEMAQKDRYGKEKQSASVVAEGFKKGKLGGSIKATGGTQEEFEAIREEKRKKYATSLDTKSRIQMGSKEAQLIDAQNKKQYEFELSQGDKKTEEILRIERETRAEARGRNLPMRALDDFTAKMFGEEFAKKDIEGAYATEDALDSYFSEARTANKLSNSLRAKDLGDKKIDTSKDSKAVR